MPRDKRPLDRLIALRLAPGVRDEALDRASGQDVDEDEEPIEDLPGELRRRWPEMSLPARQEALRLWIANLFRKRFGFPWREEWNRFVLQAPREVPRWQRNARYDTPPIVDKDGKHPRKARRMGARQAFIYMWDRVNIMNLPPRRDRARFKTVQEFVWISILGGNWPRAARTGTPDEVLRAERTLIKEALKRHGQQPFAYWDGENAATLKIPRGPLSRAKK